MIVEEYSARSNPFRIPAKRGNGERRKLHLSKARSHWHRRTCERSFDGLRQFERSFERDVGVSPKSFARIARFQSALDAKLVSPQRTWLDIAHSFGYHDQMHMIHDFEALGRTRRRT